MGQDNESDYLTVLSNISYIVIFVPLIIGVIFWKRLSFVQRMIFGIVVLTFLNDSLTIILNRQEIHNLWVYHLYVPLYFWMIALLYRESPMKSTIKKWLLPYACIFTVFSVVNSIWIQPVSGFNSNAISIGMLSYILLALIYFQFLLKQQFYTRLENDPLFWMSVGLLLFNAGALVLFIVSNYFNSSDRKVVASIWSLNVILNIILIMFYSLSLWVRPRK